ncbi:MAG: DUF4097 family beta strand repeat protein [Bacteroidota bacterium]|nr:DUF4097 family beta strand repeat protein [Bacteroidota bacterium]
MKTSLTSWIKIAIFVLVGVLFTGVMVKYSHSQFTGGEKLHTRHSSFDSFFDRGAESSRHFEKNFAVSHGGTLHLDSDDGDVDIESWDKNEVKITVDISGNEERVDKFDVRFSSSGNDVDIVGRSNENNFFKWGGGNFQVKYHVTVPSKFNLDATTAGGDMTADGISGDVTYHTSGGDITVRSIDGKTDLSTSGGDVKANNVKGDLKINTSGGDVVTDGVKGKVDAETSGGSVTVSSTDGSVHAESSGGDITVNFKGENKGINVETSGGTVELYLDDSVKATVDASTSGGRVRCELPVTVQGDVEDDELHGTINGGGATIRARSSGGDIKIMSGKNN